MTTIEDVFDAIEARLATVENLNVPGLIPDAPDFPCAFVIPVPATDYRDNADGDSVHMFEIVVLVSASLNERQRELFPYIERTGPRSIFDLFETDRDLGIDVDAHIRDSRSLGIEEIAGYRGYGAAWTLVVSLTT